MGKEFGTRSDGELGQALYNKPGESAEQGEEKREAAPGPKYGLEADLAMSKTLWPEENSHVARTFEGGHVATVVRDTSGGAPYCGRILVDGDFGDRTDLLLQAKGDRCDNADLPGLECSVAIKSASLRKANLSDSRFTTPEAGLIDCDCREAAFEGAKIRSLRGCQLTGSTWDEDSDVSEADFSGASYDLATFERIRQAKGSMKARGLYKPLK